MDRSSCRAMQHWLDAIEIAPGSKTSPAATTASPPRRIFHHRHDARVVQARRAITPSAPTMRLLASRSGAAISDEPTAKTACSRADENRTPSLLGALQQVDDLGLGLEIANSSRTRSRSSSAVRSSSSRACARSAGGRRRRPACSPLDEAPRQRVGSACAARREASISARLLQRAPLMRSLR